jgi:hypothetical protein
VIKGLTGMGAAVVLAACRVAREDLACDDTGGLTADDLLGRSNVSYVAPSPHREKTCVGCQHYTGSAERCGGCTLLKGPIHPRAYCRLWVAVR